MNGGNLREIARPARAAHGFMAIDVAALTEAAVFEARMEAYIDEINASKKAKGSELIYLPGEPEYLWDDERIAKGIPLLRSEIGP